jgi:hypothetical protein
MSTPELHWFKSSYSDSSNGNDCVEVATTPARIHIRDSKNPAHGMLTVSPGTWAEFVVSVGDLPQVG